MLIQFNNPVNGNKVEALDYQASAINGGPINGSPINGGAVNASENGHTNGKNHGKDQNFSSPHAILEERKRLARALHDNLAPSLGYLNLQLATATTLLAQGQVSEAQTVLERLKHVLDDSYTDVREEIFNLRTTVSQNTNFLTTLRQHLEKYRRYYHLDIELVLETDKKWFEFSSEASIQLIRIIQETLTNIRKHAQTKHVTIHLTRDDTGAIIQIADSGVGFELDRHLESARFGLQIMRERAESIGATLEICTTAGRGTQLIIHVPLATLPDY